MSVYKSRQVNLDPEPWVWADGGRAANNLDVEVAIWAPRPEFEPTRDPEPWACQGMHGGVQCTKRAAEPWMLDRAGRVWAPRREQFDTPVNRVLVHFRQMHGFRTDAFLVQAATAWCASPDDMVKAGAYTPDEIDHARKVLTRLAGWSA